MESEGGGVLERFIMLDIMFCQGAVKPAARGPSGSCGRCRPLDHKRRTLAQLALAHPAIHRFHHLLDDGQPEAGRVFAARRFGAQTGEFAEESLLVLGAQAGTFVLHLDADRLGKFLSAFLFSCHLEMGLKSKGFGPIEGHFQPLHAFFDLLFAP